MKFDLLKAGFIALPLTICAIAGASAADQTTVIPGKADSTVVIERDGKSPAVIDVNKDLKGKTNEEAKKAAAAQAKTTSETTGEGGKAECVSKTGKETESVDNSKSKCN